MSVLTSPNLEWIIWWLLVFASFAVLEAVAFNHPGRVNTLSRCMALMGEKFPLSIGLWGALVGGLMVHFFWHFCPSGVSVGALTLSPLVGLTSYVQL